MIHVLASIELADGQRDSFLAEVQKIVPLVRAEEGCLEYGPAVDLETNIDAQPPVREDQVTMIEKWEDLTCLEAHLIAPHMLEYRERVREMVNKVTLQVLQPAG